MRKRILNLGPGFLLGVGLSLAAARLAFIWNLFPSHDLGHASAYVREVMQIVNENYVDPAAVSYDALARSAMHGMAESLDPHSEFLESADNQELEDELNGEFGGIGVLVEILHGRVVVIAPMLGTPGERAGIQRGDQIMSIDGRPVDETITMDGIVDRLRGKPKSHVTVGLYRESTRQKITLMLTREVIKVDSIASARVLPDGIGYIRLTEFSEHTGEQFGDAIDRLLKQGISSLIIDLRDNPGGIIDSAVEVAEPFFRKGELIVYTQGRTPADREEYRAETEGDPLNLPIAVLINAGSASAAEIVTGALKDTGRAVVVGERSFGKGSVQSIFKLRNGEGLRLTVARYYTPSGVSIHGQGITPQVEVVMTPAEDQNLRDQYAEFDAVDPRKFKEQFGVEPVEDRQLQAARDVLKGVEMLDDQIADSRKAR
jgi:carboxyl-terminal processing protease